MAKIDYEIIQSKWFHTGMPSHMGYQLARDIKKNVGSWQKVGDTELATDMNVAEYLMEASASLYKAALDILEDYVDHTPIPKPKLRNMPTLDTFMKAKNGVDD